MARAYCCPKSHIKAALSICVCWHKVVGLVSFILQPCWPFCPFRPTAPGLYVASISALFFSVACSLKPCLLFATVLLRDEVYNIFTKAAGANRLAILFLTYVSSIDVSFVILACTGNNHSVLIHHVIVEGMCMHTRHCTSIP